MKNFLITILLLAGLLLLSTCNKNNDDVQPDKEYLYIINLQTDRILSFEKYNGTGDTLLENAIYLYLNDRAEKTLFQGNTIKRRTIFILENGTGKECFDTVFQNNSPSDFYHHVYTHSGRKLVKDEFENKFFTGDSLSIYNWVYDYTYNEDGNLTKLNKTVEDGNDYVSCFDVFTYASSQVFFDVNDFDSRITGAISTNLLKQKTYDSGCPGGPSYIYPKSIYSYAIIEGGYVVEMTEAYGSGYGASFRVTRNTYEYYLK
jgi:hypothetical protein